MKLSEMTGADLRRLRDKVDGKITDEEIEQKLNDYTIWLSRQISLCKKFKNYDMQLAYEDSLRKYQKLKDND